MNSLRAIACILVTIYSTSSYALQCYDCIFYDGFKNSDPSCESGPNASLLRTCFDYPSPLGGEITVCKKITGILDGKPAVVRECSHSFTEFDGKCSTDDLRIGKSFTNQAYGCICSGERCNGAAEIEFRYTSFVAIAVLNSFFRFISALGQTNM